ncbi:MAG: acyltransferase family protein [Micrococcales bacterium]|nr:acyltransferase family protein [Micrococcales bacterium]
MTPQHAHSPAAPDTAHAVAERAAEVAVPPSSGRRDLAYTSYLRVVAMVSVVLIHVAGLSYVADKDLASPPRAVAAVLTFGTKWAVPVFVMVSGVLLLRPPRERDPMTFYRRRLGKIGIPLVVWHVVYIGLFGLLVADTAPGTLLARLLRGESFTALYFFWLILGLYLVTPLLWPLVEALSQRTLLVVAVLLTVLPAADLVLRQTISYLGTSISGSDPTLVTQFLPYVGFYLLGYALRDVVLRGAARVVVLVLTLLLLAELVVQAAYLPGWHPGIATKIGVLLPVSYQGPLLGLGAVGVFLVVHSFVAPGSRLATEPWSARARTLGDLTFGVFCCHLLLAYVLARATGHPTFYGEDTIAGILLQNAVVVVGAFLVTAVLVRIPVLRRAV